MALLPVADALSRLLSNARPVGSELVPLTEAAGRVLAAPLAATLTQPPFDASAMDGYAVRATDAAASAVLTVIGEAAAGRRFQGSVGTGEAVRIFTGAPVPAGADSIVIQEDTVRRQSQIELRAAARYGEHIRRRGVDFQRDQVLLDEGRRLGAREVTLAAVMGHGELPCHRRPVVAILATGDELVPPGTVPAADQIVCSNTYGVAAMVQAAGGQPRLLGIARDDVGSLAAHIDAAAGSDILVTIGGASVGDHDLIGPVLQARGMALEFWKIAMRPGKPMLFGHLHGTRVLGLPGNPVSALICARIFLVPLVARLAGRTSLGPAAKIGIAAVDLEPNGPRTHYMRATLQPADNGGPPRVRPVHSQDSSLLSTLAAADCLLVRAVDEPAVKAGEAVQYLAIDF